MSALQMLDTEVLTNWLLVARGALRAEQRWRGTPFYDADRVEDAQAEIAALMDELSRRRRGREA